MGILEPERNRAYGIAGSKLLVNSHGAANKHLATEVSNKLSLIHGLKNWTYMDSSFAIEYDFIFPQVPSHAAVQPPGLQLLCILQ